jgi:hypothetical protein
LYRRLDGPQGRSGWDEDQDQEKRKINKGGIKMILINNQSLEEIKTCMPNYEYIVTRDKAVQ